LKDGDPSEEEMVLQAWNGHPQREFEALLVVAPRHPERFAEVEAMVAEFSLARASDWNSTKERTPPGFDTERTDLVLLDTIGDLAAVYGIADVAFVGGSLVKRGGHNPLEPAQFGVPVVMGPSFENFRDIVAKMQAANAIRIVQDRDELETALVGLLTDREAAKAMGERGRQVFEQQQGATARAVEAVVAMIQGAKS